MQKSSSFTFKTLKFKFYTSVVEMILPFKNITFLYFFSPWVCLLGSNLFGLIYVYELSDNENWITFGHFLISQMKTTTFKNKITP